MVTRAADDMWIADPRLGFAIAGVPDASFVSRNSLLGALNQFRLEQRVVGQAPHVG
jgi:hypothetical protein